MPETRWTPGPWKAIGQSVYADGPIEIVHAVKGGTDHAESEATAHLIAAAPDLYEALEKVDSELADARMIAVAIPRIRKMIHAAMAKARGEGADDA